MPQPRFPIPPSLLSPRIFPPNQSPNPSSFPTRSAHHASQGRANGAPPGPGKRLGLKRPASSLVVPGNIIFRQRGTHWFAGENCGMGRDHTIFAREKGYVVFYRERVGREGRGWRGWIGGEGGLGGGGGGGGGKGVMREGKERKFIGVVFRRGEQLPRGGGEARRRRLGMVGRVRDVDEEGEAESDSSPTPPPEHRPVISSEHNHPLTTKPTQPQPPKADPLPLRPGYQHRPSNYSIGRAAERAQVKVREYKRGDRFLAWRKLNARKARNAERRSMSKRKGKGKGKGK